MHKRVKVKDLIPNRFRRIERGYPIDKEKVSTLRESYRQTGFWGNILARQNGKGYEIAYGHHRLEALRQEFGPDEMVDVIVKKLNDPAMIKIMARENMAEWSSNAAVEHETIRAVIDAIAEGGDIAKEVWGLVPPKTSGHLKIEPGKVIPPKRSSSEDDHFYTKMAVSEFLGWQKKSDGGFRPNARFEQAWKALELMEQKILKEEDFQGLQRDEAKCVIDNVIAAHQAKQRQATEWRRTKKRAEHAANEAKSEQERKFAEDRVREADKLVAKYEKEAKEDAKKVAHETRVHLKKGLGTATAKNILLIYTDNVPLKDAAMPPRIDDYGDRVADELAAILTEGNIFNRLSLLWKFNASLSPGRLTKLVNTLRRLAKKANDWADKIDKVSPIKRAAEQKLLR